MEPLIHNEPNHEPSDYLTFSQAKDSFFSHSSGLPTLTYFRVELVRVRPGTSDFLLRVATPKYDKSQKNTLVTLRSRKEMSKFEGAKGTARVLIREMKKRGDKSHKWETADEDHLAQMLTIPLKTFALNTQMELLRFSTEALR